jgi:hypothetical protein
MTLVHMEQRVLDDLGHLGGELKEQSLGEDRHVIEDKTYLMIPLNWKKKLKDISR